jgi:predicted nucleotidyltransferase
MRSGALKSWEHTEMRISKEAQSIIYTIAHDIFGSDIRVKVFGSRLDDQARGGDIDLLIESSKPVSDARYKSLQLVARLQLLLGDQAFDVLVIDPLTDKYPVHVEALKQGVELR